MKPFYVRELSVYPVGRRRILLLAVAVLASLVANFETTLATILPLLMTDLGMSLTVYGQLAALSVLVGGLSAGFGGILSDRWGRVAILVPTLTVTAACNFLLATVDSVAGLFWVRCLMLFIEGAGITITASLVRDFSPRMGRAQAFAFWTWGPVGAAFLASFIAGFTLPLFGNAWQSQAIIMGVVSLSMCAVIIWKIAEPSGALRAQVMEAEQELAVEGRFTTAGCASCSSTLTSGPTCSATPVGRCSTGRSPSSARPSWPPPSAWTRPRPTGSSRWASCSTPWRW